MKISKTTKIDRGLYGHVCPLCGSILASASEPDLMPEYSICDCDKNGNKIPVYELYEEEGRTMVRRNKYPRFIGEVTMSILSDIDNIRWLDDAPSVADAAHAMRKASEFLKKKSRNYD